MGNKVGASGCSDKSIVSPNKLVSKFEALEREKSDSANKDQSKGNGPNKKADSADSSGSANSVGSAAANGGGPASAASNSEAAKTTDDKEPETCIVTYMSGRKQYAQQKVEIGRNVKYSIGELPDDPSEDGAHFRGWWTEADEKGKRKQFTIGTRVKEDITVYAKWVYIIIYYHDEQIIDRREFEVEAPGDTINFALELEPTTGGYKAGVLHEEG